MTFSPLDYPLFIYSKKVCRHFGSPLQSFCIFFYRILLQSQKSMTGIVHFVLKDSSPLGRDHLWRLKFGFLSRYLWVRLLQYLPSKCPISNILCRGQVGSRKLGILQTWAVFISYFILFLQDGHIIVLSKMIIDRFLAFQLNFVIISSKTMTSRNLRPSSALIPAFFHIEHILFQEWLFTKCLNFYLRASLKS